MQIEKELLVTEQQVLAPVQHDVLNRYWGYTNKFEINMVTIPRAYLCLNTKVKQLIYGRFH